MFLCPTASVQSNWKSRIQADISNRLPYIPGSLAFYCSGGRNAMNPLLRQRSFLANAGRRLP